MKKIVIAVLLYSVSAFSTVYDLKNPGDSIFPKKVQKFINKQVKEFCRQDGFSYSAYNEEIKKEDGKILYLADLSVGEDYADDAYFVVESSGRQLEMLELKCPTSSEEKDL